MGYYIDKMGLRDRYLKLLIGDLKDGLVLIFFELLIEDFWERGLDVINV